MQYYKKGTVKSGNVDYILQMLFDFSIIGNRPKNRSISFFRYINPEPDLTSMKTLLFIEDYSRPYKFYRGKYERK